MNIFSNTKKTKLVSFLILSLFLFPALSFAADGPPDDGLIPNCSPDCDFEDFMTLVRNVIEFLIWIAIPISVILFSYAGFLYVTAMGDTGKIGKAHDIFNTVFIGLLITVSAWLIVNTIVSLLLNDGAGYTNPLERSV